MHPLVAHESPAQRALARPTPVGRGPVELVERGLGSPGPVGPSILTCTFLHCEQRRPQLLDATAGEVGLLVDLANWTRPDRDTSSPRSVGSRRPRGRCTVEPGGSLDTDASSER